MITLYNPASTVKSNRYNFLSVLEAYSHFNVFVCFIDPRSDTHIQTNLRFYPVVQSTTQGKCFIAEYNGLQVKIPADPDYWESRDNKPIHMIKRTVTVLMEGSYTSKTIEFDIGKIRLPE